jgi:hypothetical protein
MGHAWSRTPTARMLLLARDAAADRPHPAGIMREQPSMDAALYFTSAATPMDPALCSAPAVALAWLPTRTWGPCARGDHLCLLPLAAPADETRAT